MDSRCDSTEALKIAICSMPQSSAGMTSCLWSNFFAGADSPKARRRMFAEIALFTIVLWPEDHEKRPAAHVLIEALGEPEVLF